MGDLKPTLDLTYLKAQATHWRSMQQFAEQNVKDYGEKAAHYETLVEQGERANAYIAGAKASEQLSAIVSERSTPQPAEQREGGE